VRAFIDDYKFLFSSDKRLKDRRRLAKSRGWKYISRRKFKADPIALFDFNLFEGSAEKRLKAITYIGLKKKGSSIRVYDYTYFGDLRQRVTTVFEYYDQTINLPKFNIRPKGSSNAIRNMFGEERMVIRTVTPEFLSNYHINTTDDFKLKESLTEEFLDQIGDHPGWTYEGVSNCIISYRRNVIVENESFIDQINRYIQIIEGLQNGKTFL